MNADKEVAESSAKKQMIEMVNKETTKFSSKKIEIDRWAEIQLMKSKASLESAKNRYEAMLLEAKAENE